jgi:hypothetical protein
LARWRIWEGAFVDIRPRTSSLFCNSRIFGEIALTIRRGSTSVPHLQYDKDKIEGHKSEIQEILSALNAPTSSSPKESAAVPEELVAQRPPIGSCDPTNSASQIGMIALALTGFVPNIEHCLPNSSFPRFHQEKPLQLADAMRSYDRLTALAIN